MNNRNKQETNRQPAQILLVALLVLMIIAIIVVGVVGVASRDVLQTAGNKQYQAVYNAAESTIFKIIDKYGDSAVNIGNLTAEPFTTGSCLSAGPNVYECTFTDQGFETKLTVEDTPEVRDYQLEKDKSLELNLSGFRGQIIVRWTGPVAMEFGLLYDDAGTTKFIGDLFDSSSAFDASGNPPTQRTLPENHAFLFTTDPGGGTNFRVDNIVGLPPTATTVSLRLTPRMDATTPVTVVNVTADNGFPKQIREFTSTSFDTTSDVAATATVFTQIPLLPQAPAPFNYALLTDDAVDKQGTASAFASARVDGVCRVGFFTSHATVKGNGFNGYLGRGQVTPVLPATAVTTNLVETDSSTANYQLLDFLVIVERNGGAGNIATIPAATLNAINVNWATGMAIIGSGDNGGAGGADWANGVISQVTNSLQTTFNYTNQALYTPGVNTTLSTGVSFLNGATIDTTGGLSSPGTVRGSGVECLYSMNDNTGVATCLIVYFAPQSGRGMLLFDGNAGRPLSSKISEIVKSVADCN